MPSLELEKTNFGFRPQVLRFLENLPALYPMIEGVTLYGSRAMGTYSEGSDIDLALHGKALDFNTLREVSAYLDGLPTLYSYDVLHYDTLDHKPLKDHIDRVGVKLV